jgi:hypothetical protein
MKSAENFMSIESNVTAQGEDTLPS